MKTSVSVLATGTAILIGVLVALAGSSGGLRWGNFPSFAWGALLIFLVQWVVFVPSWFAHTEHFFALTGSFTYLAVVALDQPHAYGDISIAKAACFHDEVPAAA